MSQARLPIPPQRPKKKGAETNTRDNHTTTMRPTSGTHAHQPHHQPAQPACADTLNRPTQTGPTYSPTPRAPWRKHPSATRTHPAHHQCRHTPPAWQHQQPRASPRCFRSPVGVAGLEPAASSSRTKRATKLRHTPKTGKQTSLFHYRVIVFSLLVPTVARSRATVNTRAGWGTRTPNQPLTRRLLYQLSQSGEPRSLTL